MWGVDMPNDLFLCVNDGKTHVNYINVMKKTFHATPYFLIGTGFTIHLHVTGEGMFNDAHNRKPKVFIFSKWLRFLCLCFLLVKDILYPKLSPPKELNMLASKVS